jgi:transposase
MAKLPRSEIKRIERAKALKNKILIGIDPARNSHTAIIYSPDRTPLTHVLSIKNNRAGLARLEKIIKNIMTKFPANPVIFAIEASGEYWKPLWHYFSQRSFETIYVPPLFVKRTRDLDDYTPRSNDPKDAARIANLAYEGRYFTKPNQPEVFNNLQQTVKTWEQVTKEATRTHLRIRSLLDKFFPEYITVFSNVTGAASLQILARWPFPGDLLGADKIELIQLINQSSGSRLGEATVTQLINLAEISIGITIGLDGGRSKVTRLINQINFYKQQLTPLRRELRQLIGQIDYARRIMTLPGIGLISTARFLGHLGDLNNFDKVNKIIDFAGLDLIASESGQFKSRRQISHRGKSGLRCILYEMSCHFVRFPNTARRKFLKCRINHKLYRQAIVAAIPHLVRTIVAVAKGDQVYQPPPANDPLLNEINFLEILLKEQSKQKQLKKAA